MKKIIAAMLAALVLVGLFAASVSASFGEGVAVIAEETKIIKSGLYGRKISFSDSDIKQGLCISDFKSIKITELPKSSDGTLILAGRRVSEGASIKRKNLPALVFIPTSKETEGASFKFTVDGYGDGCEIEFVLKFTDKVNYEPKISEDSAATLSLTTQREIGVFGKMHATDDEGDEIEYIIISAPKYGILDNVDKTTGEYVYKPTADFVGKDSFVYVARDEWGNFSTPETVTISVEKRMSEVKYTDMEDRPEYNAAVAMTAMGIMGGKILGDGVFFSPDETVSRAEFVAMAMKSAGISADSTLTESYFDDNADIPLPLRSYVATAQRVGLVSGNFENGKLLFKPNDNITKYEAALIMAKISGLDGDNASSADISTDIPVWAREGVYLMQETGVFDEGDVREAISPVTRADTASYLYRMIGLR